MPQNKDLKRLVRARMAASGETYTRALSEVRDALGPLPPAWHLAGSRKPDYETGVLPGDGYEGSQVARLRLRSSVSEPAGFGTLMQSIPRA